MAPRPPLPPFTGETARQKVSINDVPIAGADRRIFGPWPEEERGQSPPASGIQAEVDDQCFPGVSALT
jgi:nuclear transport factor 2 (NTF2) superfamily protein